MRYLVTGGAGFIGSNLVDELVEMGEVIVIDNMSTGNYKYVNTKAVFYPIDLQEYIDITHLFKNIDVVFHLAALARVQPSIEDPITYHNNNVNTILNVLMASTLHNVKKVVYSSSSSIYGDQDIMPLTEDMIANPMSPYALQKYIGEEYCRLFSLVYKLPTVCLRYFNVYGNRMATSGAYASVVSIFKQQKQNGLPYTKTGDGTNLRTYTFVGDIVRANILASLSGIVDGTPINTGQSTEYSINEIVDMFGGPSTFIGDRIEPTRNLCCNKRAEQLINWRPTMDLPQWVKENT